MPECRERTVLRDSEVEPAVAVVVCDGGAALVTEHANPGLLDAQRAKVAVPISEQQQAGAGVKPRHLERSLREVLREKDILVAVAVEVPNDGRKRRRQLRDPG